MSALLPINIYIDDELNNAHASLKTIANKLAAQFNFQTMTANWYGDEEEVLTINLLLTDHDTFQEKQSANQKSGDTKQTITTLSDDCFSSTNALIWDIVIAITAAEKPLLTCPNKVINHFLTTKLTKVLNVVADKNNLTAL